MFLSLVALSMLSAAVAMPTYGVPPAQEQHYPIHQAPPVQTFPVYLPPVYNDAPVSNVRPGHDYGTFLDVFDGPRYHHHFHPNYLYVPGGITGGWRWPHYGWDSLLSNPFYTGRRHHGKHRRRHHHSDSRDRNDCDGRDSRDC
ncbi:hypothetical protein Aduo_017810 [Ancylostoma duodenale]